MDDLPELPQSDVLELVRRRFERTPLNEHIPCELVELAPGHAVVGLAPSKSHCNGSGILHGGVIATVLDAAGWLAGITKAKGRLTIVADIQISYVDMSSNEALVATGKCVRAAAQLIYSEMELRTGSGRLLAKGLATQQVLPRLMR